MLVCVVVWLTVLMGGNASSLRLCFCTECVNPPGLHTLGKSVCRNKETHPFTLLRNLYTQCTLEKDVVERDSYMY